ncbi:Uma2 family endonuclease [Couchioplanes azureus]|uniref:Uma2 family endonuclease n=1 Tax=Couchioplanes caeruleus TaxID=56438 RepID=UPI0019B78124|nr:Uma2 family endonuclease [Couchioplanes caeruleus]GGQ58197.1 hypothetical protein GCM10010166_30220 [Couchioplanes caeruleus subsp. azureus]
MIDGRLLLPSPTGIHQVVGVEVVLALRVHCPPDRIPVPDLSLKINHRNGPRPDVVVISLDHIDRRPVPVEDALLAVEIISPDSHFRDMYAKAKVYAAAGIENYWSSIRRSRRASPLPSSGRVPTAKTRPSAAPARCSRRRCRFR